ncbi:U2 small nuclear ribonucleoprotein auxiliary factor 35 kDa subunit- protein 2 [Desmophyllum pertusum]|uniref:U2 small nuclear ribonucleoprotein auxiliary factor 35 kDa subunit- protein 2 n=1 Tax=Desmophyllum pertusum TaxID=174260 RepID=A0A9X0CCS5_9CNID|nr:U2 small nuclear ribonucleoprotein auxiliary factor 35 kDa subunit- protein 2 [Desmophyllum pertusum]
MAAEENEEDEESKKVSERQQPVKLSHKHLGGLLKRKDAAERDKRQLRRENRRSLKGQVRSEGRAVKKRLLEEEEENIACGWKGKPLLNERFRKNKEDEERKLREKLEQENNGAWHNPLAPPSNDVKSYGTEQDIVNCSFYLKTGACRFGERCSRQHPRPNSSVTLMIPAMYNDIRLSQSMLDEADQDTSLEYDEKDAYENYKQFYEDTLPEFRKAGTVVQFKACCNYEPHLRGNVYVQFTREEECAKAFALFNARWYASKQLSCEYSPVTKWKSAVCGLFERNRCPRGKNCNFLHVYRNPGNEFNHRDDFSPNRTPFNGGRGSERSDRGWRRDQWSSRHRDLDRDRSARDRDWERDRDRRQRERDWSRDRDDDRYRHRRRSKEREHSRTSERRENREQRSRRRSYSSDDGSEREIEDKHLSERLSPSVDKNGDTVIGSEDGEKKLSPTEKSPNRKRKHHASDKHKHRRKSKRNTNTAVNERRRRNAAKQVQVTLAVQRATARDSHDNSH